MGKIVQADHFPTVLPAGCFQFWVGMTDGQVVQFADLVREVDEGRFEQDGVKIVRIETLVGFPGIDGFGILE